MDPETVHPGKRHPIMYHRDARTSEKEKEKENTEATDGNANTRTAETENNKNAKRQNPMKSGWTHTEEHTETPPKNQKG